MPESTVTVRRVVLGALLLALTGGCGAPRIGEAPEAFTAVDALYTAVSLRDTSQLDRCESNLRGLREAGKLPTDAADRLASITTEARAGQWEPARSRLRDFMLAQHR